MCNKKTFKTQKEAEEQAKIDNIFWISKNPGKQFDFIKPFLLKRGCKWLDLYTGKTKVKFYKCSNCDYYHLSRNKLTINKHRDRIQNRMKNE